MSGPTPHYLPEFKWEALEFYCSSEKSILKVAKQFGITDEPLRGGSASTRSTQASARDSPQRSAGS